MKYTAVCPVHEFERRECSDFCLPERVEKELASHALRNYWRDRRLGMRPLERSYPRPVAKAN